MLSPFKHVLGKSKSLVVKMHTYAPKSKFAWGNLDLLCDLELVFGLPCILPMLEMVHTLIKYARKQKVFIYEFIDDAKSTEAKLHRLYVDPFCKYDDYAFNESLLFVNIVVSCCHSLGFHMSLMLIYTCCHIWNSTLLATTMDSITLEVSNGAYVHVNISDQYAMIESMKVACSKVTTTLCVELFHNSLMWKLC